MLKSLRRNFITGFAVLLPALLTIWLVKFVIGRANMLLLEPLVQFLRPFILDSTILEYIAKVLILIFTVLAIAFIGFGTRLIFLKEFFLFLEMKFVQFPMLGKIYGTIREISHLLFGRSKSTFTRVVLVEFPRKGSYAVAFITAENKYESGRGKLLNVYVPSTPNPATGFLLLIPEEEVISVDMTIDEGLKLVISGGIVPLPERVKIKKKDGDTDN